MFRTIALIGAVASLSGCIEPARYFVKNGVTLDRYERDTVDCVNKATAKAPASNQTQWVPYVGIYTVDANTGLRQANVEICMRDKGYSYPQVPSCSSKGADVSKLARENGWGKKGNRKERLNISGQSCVIIGPKGATLLYTPQ
jgi:hypothetical protein